MISTSRNAGLAVLAALVLMAGCEDSLAPVWWAEPDGPVDVVVQTDAELYEATVVPYPSSDSGGWRVQISGHYRIENRGERSVWFSEFPVSLEGYFGGEWMLVCTPGLTLPGNRRVRRLAPGEEMTVPFNISGYSPETNTIPGWRAPDVEGTFRLVRVPLFIRSGSDVEVVPAEMTRSNSFEVRADEPS